MVAMPRRFGETPVAIAITFCDKAFAGRGKRADRAARLAVTVNRAILLNAWRKNKPVRMISGGRSVQYNRVVNRQGQRHIDGDIFIQCFNKLPFDLDRVC